MKIKAMRDVFLKSLYEKMGKNNKIFFISADFGAPMLDKIRQDYPDRFINVGIAEQNLVNVATGLALEGFIVYAYAIAPFITMRCYEQIRVNVSILSQIRPMNINFIGVGAGVSYAMSGPTHHCLEDLSIMKTLPNMEVFSPSDYMIAQAYVERTLSIKTPKYIRFDAKPMIALENNIQDFDKGFRILQKGGKLAIISTGYMTQKAMKIVKDGNFNITLIDLYFINNYNKNKLENTLKDIDNIITIEEAFKGCGGLDAEINFNFKDKKIVNLGFEKKYTFEIGEREFIHKKNSVGENNIIEEINKCLIWIN
jgi:transketolase